MNKIFDPKVGDIIECRVDENSTFVQINDALYFHEKPFYAYCAKGAGENPEEREEWRAERERLYALWQDKCPYKPVIDPCAIKGTRVMLRCVQIFRAIAGKKT